MFKPGKILLVITAIILLLTAIIFCVKLIPSTPVSMHSVTRQMQSDRLNINTATASELEKLPGIGPVLARSIVDYRDENGKFEKAGDLLLVPGIGQRKLEAIADLITVGG